MAIRFGHVELNLFRFNAFGIRICVKFRLIPNKFGLLGLQLNTKFLTHIRNALTQHDDGFGR
jgi:hypothetical protein